MSRAPWRATALALVLLAAAAPAAHATLSIVARDSVSGEIGVAVKSRGMRVGGVRHVLGTTDRTQRGAGEHALRVVVAEQ